MTRTTLATVQPTLSKKKRMRTRSTTQLDCRSGSRSDQAANSRWFQIAPQSSLEEASQTGEGSPSPIRKGRESYVHLRSQPAVPRSATADDRTTQATTCWTSLGKSSMDACGSHAPDRRPQEPQQTAAAELRHMDGTTHRARKYLSVPTDPLSTIGDVAFAVIHHSPEDTSRPTKPWPEHARLPSNDRKVETQQSVGTSR